MPGWNYLVHLYRPRREILDGLWKFPEALRGTTREALVTLFDEELTQVLGAAKGERVVRRGGYRHGERERALTTGLGRVQVTVPRGRLFTPDGPGPRVAESLLAPLPAAGAGPQGGGEPPGGGGRAAALLPLPEVPVELAADHQRLSSGSMASSGDASRRRARSPMPRRRSCSCLAC
jgi:hypothetical protein